MKPGTTTQDMFAKAAKSLGLRAGKKQKRTHRQAVLFDFLRTIRDGDRPETDLLDSYLAFCLPHFRQSKAQLFQDLLALFFSKEKKDGTFVEFGASDGILFSNTFLLEKAHGWTGILAEPARTWHDRLSSNRSCIIDHRCVWSASGETVQFNEVADAEYSTIEQYSAIDQHADRRTDGDVYDVETISLNDLLTTHNAPRHIDYLSIDTEGSEYEILRNFEFQNFDISVVTIEHNFQEKPRQQIYDLLVSKGYQRIFEEISGWDDWFVDPALLPKVSS